MSRIDVDQGDILLSVKEFLMDSLALDASQVHIVVDPMNPVIPLGGDYWLSVSPGDGRFDEALAESGAAEQCTEDFVVSVYIYSRIYLDETNSDEKALLDPERGVLRIKKKVLVAMTGYDLQVNGQPFGRGLLIPNYTSSRIGMIDREGDSALQIATTNIDFSMPFDWDLTT